MAEEGAQAGVIFRGVDSGAPRRQRHGGRLAGGLSEDRRCMGGGAVLWSTRRAASAIRGVVEARLFPGHGCEGLPVQDDGAVLSQSRVRADQAVDEYSDRSRIRAG